MSKDITMTLNNGIVIRKYSNGSYAFFNEKTKSWNNINSVLAEVLIENELNDANRPSH